jgi:hypothetical protein
MVLFDNSHCKIHFLYEKRDLNGLQCTEKYRVITEIQNEGISGLTFPYSRQLTTPSLGILSELSQQIFSFHDKRRAEERSGQSLVMLDESASCRTELLQLLYEWKESSWLRVYICEREWILHWFLQFWWNRSTRPEQSRSVWEINPYSRRALSSRMLFTQDWSRSALFLLYATSNCPIIEPEKHLSGIWLISSHRDLA